MAEQKYKTCPQCGKLMTLRDGKRGKFWGCSGFPTCRKTLDFVEEQPDSGKEYKLSVYQQAVVDAIKDPDGGNLVIEAVAGSGKTFIIVHCLRYTHGEVIFLAFNKAIAMNLRKKAPEHVNCSTIHSLGKSCIDAALPFRPIVDDKKKMGIAKEMFPEEKDGMLRLGLVNLASKCQNTLTDPYDTAAVMHLIDRYDIDFEHVGTNSDSEQRAIAALPIMLRECQTRTGVIDFDDMIWLPIVLNLPIKQHDWVFGDEIQDMNAANIELILRARKPNGRIVAVGDRNQCQPEGTLVYKTGVGYVPIESIQPGDELMTYFSGYMPGKNAQGRVVKHTASRNYDGVLIDITADTYKHSVTPEHRCLVRMANRNGWAVYLVKRGSQVRVGTTKSIDNPAGSVAMRGRQEIADCAWILDVFDDINDAHLLENLVAYQYGIPQVCFQRKWETNTKTIRTQHWLDAFWELFPPNEEALVRCLEDYGRDIRYPFWTRGKDGGTVGNKKGSLYTFVTQSCNLISGWMRVCTFDGHTHVTEDNWKTVDVSRCTYTGKVYSLELESRWRGHPVYVAQGIVTHNSIYGFRGADTNAIPRLIEGLNAKTLPLSITYRCPVSHVKMARMLVPQIEPTEWAEEGELQENLAMHKAVPVMADGDLIMCRTNAPLVSTCYQLIRMGRKATIQGRDIGQGLIQLIDKMRANDINNLLEKMKDYRWSEREKLTRAGKEHRIDALEDKCECIIALTDGVSNLSELRARIETIFTDDVSGIVLSTVHRAKGLEAVHTFILRPDLLPFPKAKSEIDIQQEMNIMYVALTRSKMSMSFIDGPAPNVDPEQIRLNARKHMMLVEDAIR